MDKNEIVSKFCELHNYACTNDSERCKDVTCDVFRKSIEMLAEENMSKATELLEMYEGALMYDNYLTEREAERIVGNFVNYDGSRGAYWVDSKELFKVIEDMDKRVEEVPAYNKWALYVAMNMVASDQGDVIMRWIGEDKFVNACYEFAITHLKDKDRVCWVREYFGV